MTLSLPPEANQRLSGLKTTAFTDLVWPVCRINSGLSPVAAGGTDEGVCVGPEGIPSPLFSCSFVCEIPLTGAQIMDSKSITDDIFRLRRGDIDESKTTCLFVDEWLADGRVRTIRFLLEV